MCLCPNSNLLETRRTDYIKEGFCVGTACFHPNSIKNGTSQTVSWLSLVCRAAYLWIQNEDLVNDWLEVLHFLSSSDLREAIWDPGTLLVYSNDQSARQGSDSVDASNFLQHNGSPPLPFLCLFCCLLPQTDNWFVLICWASFPDDSSSCFGRQALWGNPFPALL